MDASAPVVSANGPAAQPSSRADNREALAVLLAPSLRGRRVLVLGPGDERSWLAGAGAAEVTVGGPAVPGGPPLPGADGEYEVVLALDPDAGAGGPLGWTADGAQTRATWLAEIERVLAPEGFCLFRTAAGPAREGAWLSELHAHWKQVLVVDETPFVGACFSVAGTDDMAVAGNLGRLQAGASHRLVLCAPGERAPWELGESLLIPLSESAGSESARLAALVAEQAARLRALTADGDELREALMARQDEDERRDDALVWLRQEAERQLGIISADQAALEVMSLEKAASDRRAAQAASALAAAEVTLRRRATEIAGLEREIARLQARLAATTRK